MCDRATLDLALRLVAKGNQLPTCWSWPALKEELVETKMFSSEALETSHKYIIQKFGQLRIEVTKQHTDKLLANPAPVSSSNTSSEVPVLESGSDRSENSSKDSETDEEESLQPTLDEEAIAERTRFMSLSVNGYWEGAVLKYCLEPESFVHKRIVDRYRLDVVDQRIRSTWMFHDSSESHVTRFLVRKDLEADFILGKSCCDEAFNRETASPSSTVPRPMSPLFEQPTAPTHGYAQHPTQAWVNQQTAPNTRFIAETIYELEKRYRHEGIPDPASYMLPPLQGGIIGEESHSSASSVPNHGSESGGHSRKSRSKTHRSTSRSNK